jgi:hypothetical protein
MESSTEKRTVFLGAYFDRDAVLKVARLAGILAWGLLILYAYSAFISVGQYIFMLATGVVGFQGNIFDQMSILSLPFTQLAPGLLYFTMLKIGQQALLILLEMEDNSRRAAKK